MTPEQRNRTLDGIKKALAAIEDGSPVTPEEVSEHNRLVVREIARHTERQENKDGLGLN